MKPQCETRRDRSPPGWLASANPQVKVPGVANEKGKLNKALSTNSQIVRITGRKGTDVETEQLRLSVHASVIKLNLPILCNAER